MTHFISVSLLVISVLLCQVHTQDIYFSATHEEVTALYKTEERLFSALDAFISEKEEHLKELENVLSKMATSRALSGEDIGEFLGNPLNQFHVVKRFVDDWGKLGEYLFSDRSTDGKFGAYFDVHRSLNPKASDGFRS